MTSNAAEQAQTPEQMLLDLKAEMNSIKAEEKSMKAQLVSLNEQFKLLVKSATETYPEILDEEFPKKVAARQQLRYTSPYRPLRGAEGTTRTPSFTRSSYRSQESPHRRPMLDMKRYPRRFARMNSEEAAAQIQEQFENNANTASGIDARKIRSSVADYPTDHTALDPNQENSNKERRQKLKKKMMESRKIDVVNLGLF